MSIKTKLATLAIAALAVTAVTTSSYAKPKFNPIVPALVGAAVVGTAIAAGAHHHHHAHRRCIMVPARDFMGHYLGYYVERCRVVYH
jgi:hypothetical protein